MINNPRGDTTDLLLAGAMTVLVLITAVQTVDGTERTWALVIGALTVAPLALRQRAPVVVTVTIMVSLLAYSLLGYGEFPNGAGGLVIAMFTVAVLRPPQVALLLWVASGFVTAVMFVTTDDEHMPWSWAMQAPLTVLAGGWLLGEVTKHWAARAERLAGEAARAVARERASIARELHDVVAHHMAVVSMQAGVAEHTLDSDPATARAAITTAGHSSREALTEMRRLLKLLRPAEGEDARAVAAEAADAATPGLDALDELVNRIRDAGVPVDVVVTGDARPLSPGTELCAYRVVQEALTNVVKHAGPATARIDLNYGEEVLTLKISDTGAGSGTVKSSEDSYGLRGMRERAALYDGTLTTGPARDGGFEVTLRLPIGEAA
ncbi:sensor histidine kinase [Streptomyces sp. 4N509B]|uniref:sensor histidine kinase n=1 Tax=Streptomyces sp. 4N509B TaxID=3457413 RepID=UPI003FD1D3F0